MSSRTFLDYLHKQSFQPDFWSVFINPFFFIRKALFQHIKMLSPHLSGKLLDFGCGRKPYENLFTVSEYIGIDMEKTGHEHASSKVDIFYNGKEIPFPDESFDSIFCSEVLEHVFNLNEILPELRRVLKKGGKMLITVPFCWNEHEVPFDFGRYTSFGIQYILKENGFEIDIYKKSGDFARVNFQLWALYCYSLIQTRSRLINYLCRMLFILPINIGGSISLFLLPNNDSLYFNNVLLVTKI
jgi:SAM-dependent methyltransferase